MTHIAGSVRTLMLSDADIQGQVGTRCYSDVLPQNAELPAITYFTISTIPYEALVAAVPIAGARIQIDCFASSRSASVDLADLVRLKLQKYRGLVGSQYINEISLQSGQRHEHDRPAAGDDHRRFLTSQDFLVHYTETVGA